MSVKPEFGEIYKWFNSYLFYVGSFGNGHELVTKDQTKVTTHDLTEFEYIGTIDMSLMQEDES